MSKRKSTILSLSVLLLITFFSCENKRDNNGDLGGNWQLLEWRDAQNQVVKDKTSGIFYGVHKTLFQFKDGAYDTKGYFLSYFKHAPDSLIFYHIVNYPTDTLATPKALEYYGVPASGRFHIDRLDADNMVLSTKDRVLVFRKY